MPQEGAERGEQEPECVFHSVCNLLSFRSGWLAAIRPGLLGVTLSSQCLGCAALEPTEFPQGCGCL